MEINIKDYLDWLTEFTKEHNSFSDDSFDYKDMPEIDKENSKKLSYLQSYIEREKEKQKVFNEEEDDYCISAYFKYKENYFYIDTIIGQGAFTSIKRLSEKPTEDFVYLFEEIPKEILEDKKLIHCILINKENNLNFDKLNLHIADLCTAVTMKECMTDKFEQWYRNTPEHKYELFEVDKELFNFLGKKFYAVKDKNDNTIAISLGIKTIREIKELIPNFKI